MGKVVVRNYRYCVPTVIICIFLVLVVLIWTLNVKLPDIRMVPVLSSRSKGIHRVHEGRDGSDIIHETDGDIKSMTETTLSIIGNSAMQSATPEVSITIQIPVDDSNSIIQRTAEMTEDTTAESPTLIPTYDDNSNSRIITQRATPITEDSETRSRTMTTEDTMSNSSTQITKPGDSMNSLEGDDDSVIQSTAAMTEHSDINHSLEDESNDMTIESTTPVTKNITIDFTTEHNERRQRVDIQIAKPRDGKTIQNNDEINKLQNNDEIIKLKNNGEINKPQNNDDIRNVLEIKEPVSSADKSAEQDLLKDIFRFDKPKIPLKRNISIMLYHPYHGIIRSHSQHLNMKVCPYHNCQVETYSEITTHPINVDALIFQGNNIPVQKPRRRNTNQVFMFLNTESPQYLQQTQFKNVSTWNNFFNWTMTYRLDSDIPYTYGGVVPKADTRHVTSDVTDWQQYIQTARNGVYATQSTATVKHKVTGSRGKDYSAIFHRKKHTAAWVVSHCSTQRQSNRETYVTTMADHIDIDVYGRCSHRECSRDGSCDKMIIRDYSFYIAFENSLCNDYITEKAYKWYGYDIILVVRGARRYSHLLPVGTCVDADDFRSPRHLAEFLTQLAVDKSRYIGYLKRKDEFRVLSQETMYQMAYCEICKRLNHLEQYRKTVKDIHVWWTGNQCTKPAEFKRTIGYDMKMFDRWNPKINKRILHE